MSVDGPRTSVFTFQSAVHSHHVLRSLEELREKELLCDVTVEVERRSFRAHSSVLASCSGYFYTRLTNHSQANLTVRLPDEVTVEGFEPLLQFAYTAKLHFTKENILEIHRCAQFLGFQNLDKACFEFLVPKLSDGGGASKKVTSKSKNQASHDESQAICSPNGPNPETDEDCVPQDASAAMQAASVTSSAESPKDCPPISNDKEMQLDLSPLYTRSTSYHMDDGQDQFCLQNCGPQLPSSSLAAAEVCPFLSISSTSDNEKLHSSAADCGGDILAMEDEFQKELAVDMHCEPPTDKDLNIASITKGHFDQCEGPVMPSTDCTQLCPLNSAQSSGVLDGISGTPDLSNIGTEDNRVFDSNEQTFSELTPKDCCTERSMEEREVAEHLAKGFWPDLSSTLNEQLPLDSIDQPSAGNGSDFHWLKHLDLGAAPDDCPFLRDLSSNNTQTSGRDTLSKEDTGDSPCMSPINSRENSECESDGDCTQCSNSEQVQEVDLPFPVEQISSMTRRAFLQMLKREELTPEQLEFVQDVRRRSKNRMAAQRCRKRKLDCIYRLEGEIKKLRSVKEKLLQDHNQLKLSIEDVRQSLSGLCQSLCMDASPQSEQVQAMARYVSSDCPTSVLLTPMASPSLAGPDQDTHGNSSLDTFLADTYPEGDTVALRLPAAFLQDSVQSTVTDPAP
ncbi:transcription regulator protein BACH1-like isoform X1 [Carassius auratus]|uniref:Transcription regulator protein BACH1-like isoform X1 n=2 Tax=Carassius auratus TaxID=7957 RepID=A0A6P6LDQ1_CARAU|nr:transcription regulator protein BACH1-like isoform X1 [Carassius auratus]XP_026082719.1 transcription regulator protein BACH1-like isoform X1 [Carassius auratus]